jgi:hypothetical protein
LISEKEGRELALDLPRGPGDQSLEQRRENKEGGGPWFAPKSLEFGLK